MNAIFPPAPKIAFWLLATAAILYCVALVALYFHQNELLYPPIKHLSPVVSDGAFDKARFSLKTADGEVLDALFLPARNPGRPWILYMHGNASDLEIKFPRAKALNAYNFSVLTFDWRGFGRSTGTPSEEGLLRDAAAAFAWMRERAEQSKIVVFGESLGTGVAVDLATRQKFAGLVLEGAYSSTADVGAYRYPMFPVRLIMRDQFRSDLKIGKITMPLLQQHGTADSVIPFRLGQKLFALAPEPKTFIAYKGADHNELPEHFGSYEDLAKFVEKVAGAEVNSNGN